MNKCVNCDYTTENDEKFCPVCGGEIVAETVAEALPAAKPASNAMPITGMIFSIVGLHSSVNFLLVNLVLFLAGGSYVFPILSTISATVGLILSIMSAKRRGKSTFTRLGITFSIIALGIDVLHSIALILLTTLLGALVVALILTHVVAPH